MRVFVGLGGNVGGEAVVRARFAAAAEAMAALPGVRGVRLSSVWRTAPVGPVAAQPAFLNAAAELLVDAGAPGALLAALLDIEAAHGRDRARETPQGPRPLDLDLLLWGDAVVDDPGPPRVIVPHPRLSTRAFALAPLVELAGEDLTVPGAGPVGRLLAAATADPAQRVEKL